MSQQTYTLTSAVFGPTERSSERVRVDEAIECVRYFMKRLFGCWHLQMGRPFTRGSHTYRACAQCGMRREFDLNAWKMMGRYHCEPAGKSRLTLMGKTGAVAVNNRNETAGNRESRRSTFIYLFGEQTWPPSVGTSALSKR